MNVVICQRCDAAQEDVTALVCEACGQPINESTAFPREVKPALFAEISRRAREEAWLNHVPSNRFVERQHSALRTAFALIALAMIVMLPTAGYAIYGASLRIDSDPNFFVPALLIALAIIALASAGAALYVAYRIIRSFRAYGRAPLEHCPALIVLKRRVALGKSGKENYFVMLEFASGERRDYRSDKLAFDTADAGRAGLAYLRANHLLELRLLPN